MPEDEEKPTAVYAKKVHKGGFDEVNRVISKQTLNNFIRFAQIIILPMNLLPQLALIRIKGNGNKL
jgi:hypothetical protein